MNPPIDPTEPDAREPSTAVDPVDERLSAALDGEADPGPAPESPPVAADQVARSLSDRSRAIARARDLLAAAPPPLDDLTRRRLLRTAVDALETPRRPRRWIERAFAPAAAAACAALVVLAGWALIGSGRSSSKSSSGDRFAASATTAPRANTTASLDLGEVSDPTVLRQKVEAALRTAVPTVPQLGPATGGAPTATTGPGATCVSTLRVPPGVHAGPLAAATFHGTPATVIVARDGPRTLIYVLATADCRLLSSQFLRR